MRRRKSTRYPLLREIFETTEELADVIGKSRTYVLNRMNGDYVFSIKDKQKICDYAGISQEEIVV